MRVVAMLVIGALIVPCILPRALGSDAELTITPDKCVSLREGQTCYQTLRIKFVSSQISDYCLKIINRPSPLRCWSGVASVDYRYSLASDSTVEFQVVDAEQATVASARVIISWVYKQSRRRSRWRLF